MNPFSRTLVYLTRTLAAALVVLPFLFWTSPAQADSVGQVQTTQYFAPETVQMLRDRLLAGQAGLQSGDIVNYILQFTPIANGANTSAANLNPCYSSGSNVERMDKSVARVAVDGHGAISAEKAI